MILHNEINKGKCTSCGVDNTQCAVFGMKADQFPSRSRTNVQLYFNTTSQAPFCRNNTIFCLLLPIIQKCIIYFHFLIRVFHYGIAISLANPQRAKHVVNGQVSISLYGSKNIINKVPLVTTNVIVDSLLTSKNSIAPKLKPSNSIFQPSLILPFLLPIWNSMPSL